jgi:hypothetical protein
LNRDPGSVTNLLHDRRCRIILVFFGFFFLRGYGQLVPGVLYRLPVSALLGGAVTVFSILQNISDISFTTVLIIFCRWGVFFSSFLAAEHFLLPSERHANLVFVRLLSARELLWAYRGLLRLGCGSRSFFRSFFLCMQGLAGFSCFAQDNARYHEERHRWKGVSSVFRGL